MVSFFSSILLTFIPITLPPRVEIETVCGTYRDSDSVGYSNRETLAVSSVLQ